MLPEHAHTLSFLSGIQGPLTLPHLKDNITTISKYKRYLVQVYKNGVMSSPAKEPVAATVRYLLGGLLHKMGTIKVVKMTQEPAGLYCNNTMIPNTVAKQEFW